MNSDTQYTIDSIRDTLDVLGTTDIGTSDRSEIFAVINATIREIHSQLDDLELNIVSREDLHNLLGCLETDIIDRIGDIKREL